MLYFGCKVIRWGAGYGVNKINEPNDNNFSIIFFRKYELAG